MPGEYRAIWNTAGGGTGYSVFHTQAMVSTSNAQNAANAIRTWFTTLAGALPNEVSVSFDSEFLELDNAGTLLSVYPVTPPTTVVGTNSGAYSRAAGIRVDWTTGVIVAGRRLTGRTFLVPIGATQFDSDGLVSAATISSVLASNATLLSTLNSYGNLAVWSRQHGVTHDVVGSSVPAKGAILRGRRD